MKKIRILIADAHDIVKIGIRQFLTDIKDIEIIAMTDDGKDAIKKIEELKPDIVVLDIELPGVTGIELTEHISRNFPKTKVIVYTTFTDKEHIINSLKAGAHGYVPKCFKTDDLLEAIRTVMNNSRFIKGIVSEILREYSIEKRVEKNKKQIENIPLTAREFEILKHLANGLPIKNIADKVKLSHKTIEKYRAGIMKKLKFENVPELVKYTVRQKIIKV